MRISRHKNPSLFFAWNFQRVFGTAIADCVAMSQIISGVQSEPFAEQLSSAQPPRPLHLSGELSDAQVFPAETLRPLRRRRELPGVLLNGIIRRWKRERRRRKVGRAYDMALEIARVIPYGSDILDVGCGNGFITHHLSAMLGGSALGIDLGNSAEAPIDYRHYDAARFPAPAKSFDAVLLCYVLHHAQEVSVVLEEVRRVLRDGGLAIVYEDIPERPWDKGVCWIHNQQWRGRTGPCTFRSDSEWRVLFKSMGFEIMAARRLSRWRNFTHPVSRKSYVLLSAWSDSSGLPAELRDQRFERWVGTERSF
jgi:SAM-dependent methyltransferase